MRNLRPEELDAVSGGLSFLAPDFVFGDFVQNAPLPGLPVAGPPVPGASPAAPVAAPPAPPALDFGAAEPTPAPGEPPVLPALLPAFDAGPLVNPFPQPAPDLTADPPSLEEDSETAPAANTDTDTDATAPEPDAPGLSDLAAQLEALGLDPSPDARAALLREVVVQLGALLR
ncbi:MAG: hypothetical protein ACFB2Z_13310 [Maricaulaceae bacterium]